jgi:hypothetical protein
MAVCVAVGCVVRVHLDQHVAVGHGQVAACNEFFCVSAVNLKE